MTLLETITEKMGENAVSGGFVKFCAHDEDWQILPNFRLHELLTKNRQDTTTILHIPLLEELQAIRDAFGKPIRITSSYRSPEYNRSVNGATSSQHALGRALDIQPIDGSYLWQLKQVVKNLKKSGGIGTYKTFVHIDTGRTRKWQG